MSFKNIISATLLLLMGSGVYAQEQDTTKTIELKEAVVSGTLNKYKPDSSAMLTRMPMKIIEIPQQIQVVSRSLMNDQQSFILQDVLKNSSGVIAAGGYGTGDILLRGFDLRWENYLYNGQRGAGMGQAISGILPHIEEVQILKGASGVLFGEGGLGGTINMVTKKPLDYHKYEVAVSGGSFGTFRTTFDATSPLTKNKRLAYRISGGYEDAGSFMQHFYNKTFIVAPSLQYKLGNSTELEWNGTYAYDKRNVGWQNGVPSVNGNIFALSRNFTSNDANDWAIHNNVSSQFGIKQKIVKGLTLNAFYTYSRASWESAHYITNTSTPVDSAGNLERYFERNSNPTSYTYNSVNAFLNYKITTGKINHSFVGGYDYNSRADLYPKSVDIPVSGFNVFNPVYQGNGKDTLTGTNYLYAVNSVSQAGYLQYLFQWNKKLNVLLGGRYQNYHFDFEYTEEGQTPYKDTSDTKVFLPRVGISYVIAEKYSIFAGYNQGFNPQSSNNPSAGGPFPAETGNQYEIGFKADLIKNRLSATLSYYQITKNNVLTRDLNDTTGLKLTPKGEVQSKGLELDVMGSITDNWKIIANFAYNDVKVTKSNTETEIGQRFSNSIPVMANLWTVYKFDKYIKGLRIGAGVNYSDKRLIVADPKLEAPAYTVLNALVGYETGNLELTLNINNITNVDYVTGSSYNSPNYIFRGAPTNFLLSLRYRFSKI